MGLYRIEIRQRSIGVQAETAANNESQQKELRLAIQ